MAAGIRARLTPRPRSFGLTVGAAFVALSALLAWRGHTTVAAVLGAIGATLVIAGLARPRILVPVERAWMAMAHAISKVTTPIVMGVMYFGVVTPVALLRRAFGGNPMRHAQVRGGFWKERAEGARRTRSLERQF